MLTRSICIVSFQLGLASFFFEALCIMENPLHASQLNRDTQINKVLAALSDYKHPSLVPHDKLARPLIDGPPLLNFDAFKDIHDSVVKNRIVSSASAFTDFRANKLAPLGKDSKSSWDYFGGGLSSANRQQQKYAESWLKAYIHMTSPLTEWEEDLTLTTWCLNRSKVKRSIWWSSAQLEAWRQEAYDYRKIVRIGDLLQFDSEETIPLASERYEEARKQLTSVLQELDWEGAKKEGQTVPKEIIALRALHDANGNSLYDTRSQQLLGYMYARIGEGSPTITLENVNKLRSLLISQPPSEMGHLAASKM
ncbi:hypothetical protein O181_000854 [Austropuccinia psidii MF-1]|uniref:Uncharacterized protein n=1 Tax=Austropuccinia psidii MF-1 TaxID=1389203 RepID=A0A9Q3GBA9_9BASI|nr:hypothetical protein [Austropuccinia psidii MF-1]